MAKDFGLRLYRVGSDIPNRYREILWVTMTGYALSFSRPFALYDNIATAMPPTRQAGSQDPCDQTLSPISAVMPVCDSL